MTRWRTWMVPANSGSSGMWVRMSSSREKKPAFRRLEHDGEGGELLRGRADVGARVGLEGDPVGEVGRAVGVRVDRLAVSPHADRGTRRLRAVEARHHLVGEFFRVGCDWLVAKKSDFVVAGVVRVVACREKLDGVRPCDRGLRTETFGPASQASEAPDLGLVGAEHADRDVDRDLGYLAEHELVLLRVDRVAGRVSGRESGRDRAVRLQFRGLSHASQPARRIGIAAQRVSGKWRPGRRRATGFMAGLLSQGGGERVQRPP